MINNTTLTGKMITIEPMKLAHAPGLYKAGDDDRIWRFMMRGKFESVADTEGFINIALEDAQNGSQIPFVIKSNSDGRVIGSTRYLDIQPYNRALEVGWTFIHPDCWGTNVAVEMKYLMFCEAFASDCLRVMLKTDSRNHRAMKHIANVGAIQEGVLRQHMLAGDGVQRDTVMYSIIREQWPQVKAHLETLLKQ